MNMFRCVLWIRLTFLLVSLRLESIYARTSSIPADCFVGGQVLNCAYSIPQQIPQGITRVYIRGFNKKAPVSIRDEHAGWENIVEFDLTINKSIRPYQIADNAFSALKNLTTLGIHGRFVTDLGKYSFAGLDHLEELDLSGCMYLSLQDDIIPAIRGAALPNISSLNIAEVETADFGKLVINDEVIDMINEKFITTFTISSTNILLQNMNYSRPVSLQYLDMSNITAMSTNDQIDAIRLTIMLSNLKTFITNDNNRYNMLNVNSINEHITCCDATFIFKDIMLEQVYGNKLSANSITIKNSSVDFAGCHLNFFNSLKLIHAKSNHIDKLDVTITFPENVLEELDVSHNDIRYISPMMLKDVKSLRYLFLAYNNLHFMEYRHEFADLLANLISLEEISMSYNHLTIIPRTMFSNNKKLEIIDLSGNNLETVNFGVEHLKHLMLINLKAGFELPYSPPVRDWQKMGRTGWTSHLASPCDWQIFCTQLQVFDLFMNSANQSVPS